MLHTGFTNQFTARTVPLQPTGPADNSRGFAQRLADQRKVLIGEYIHHTRFQPPVQFLIEGFKKPSLHDFAQRLADQRKALIGEYIHHTRFQPPVQFLIEGFKKLSLHDYTNTESATRISDTISTKPSKATENSFGSSKPRNPTPELPHHLRNIVPATDQGAAVRAPYGEHSSCY